MRFTDPEQEKAFIEEAEVRTNVVSLKWTLCAVAVAVGASYWTEGAQEIERPTKQFALAQFGFAVVLIFLGIFALIAQEYAGRRNAFYYDLLTVFVSTAGIMGIIVLTGLWDYDLHGNHSELEISDALPWLAIVVCLTFLHLSFEVRTRYSWVAPVFSSAMYAAFTVPPGLSPEGFSKSVYNSVWLCVLGYLGWRSRWSIELRDRQLWNEERTLAGVVKTLTNLLEVSTDFTATCDEDCEELEGGKAFAAAFGAQRISPERITRWVVVMVSHATREAGSLASIASRIASEMRSDTLSGWPSVTDSEVNFRVVPMSHHLFSAISTAP